MLICMEDTIDMVLDTVDTMVMVLVLDTASKACKNNNMMNLIYLACLSAVMAAPPSPPVYPTPGPTQEYNPDIGQTNVGGYGVNKDPYCHMVEKVVFETSASLTPRGLATLRTRSLAFPGFLTTVLVLSRPRSNELVCDLVEAIHYETLEETYQVQRCFTGKDRVCN